MRSILSFVVALGLMGLGPLPLSACALVYSQQTECATPQTKTQCERMGMDQAEQASSKFSAASKNCCVVSHAPPPDARTWAGNFYLTAAPAIVSGVIVATQPFENERSRDVRQDLSPPRLQSLLCTFLI
jgi:hypothetical protein